jgi:prevent-host-death family protein
MKKAGIREARQHLSTLIDEVRSGVEIVITDRGRPVARLVPYTADSRKPFPDRSAFRASMPKLVPTLSHSLVEEREDRL